MQWSWTRKACAQAPVAHETSLALRLPHLNHSSKCEDGEHFLPSEASLLSSKRLLFRFQVQGTEVVTEALLQILLATS